MGLWKYVGSDSTFEPRYVAVKALLVDAEDIFLDQEAELQWCETMLFMRNHILTNHLRRLFETKSEHIAGVYEKPLSTRGRNGVQVRRLLMEYCPLGTIHKLLQMREQSKEPFEEITLWSLLDCFVDALSVVVFGQEAVSTGLQNPWTMMPRRG